jgi:hypothetical protein
MAKVSKRTNNIEGVAPPKGFQALPSGLWTPQRTTAVAGNLVRAYQNASPESLKLGAEFYPGWHEDAQHLGEATGQGVEAGAAMMAHISPSNEAEANRMQALQLVHGLDDKAALHIGKAAAAATRQKGAEVRMRNAIKAGDHSEANRWHEEYQQHKAENDHFRGKSGIMGTPLGMIPSTYLNKALEVKHGLHDEDPLGSLGDKKIGDFGRLIADPHGYERAPIDTHYHDASLNRNDIPYKQERGLSSVGRYENFQNAHFRARRLLGEVVGQELETGEMMGGIWYAHQQKKVNERPNAMRARKAADTKLRNIQASPAAQPFLPEKFGLRPSLGKIATG